MLASYFPFLNTTCCDHTLGIRISCDHALQSSDQSQHFRCSRTEPAHSSRSRLCSSAPRDWRPGSRSWMDETDILVRNP